jgi:DNA-binding MarR family transcriptional regulator
MDTRNYTIASFAGILDKLKGKGAIERKHRGMTKQIW